MARHQPSDNNRPTLGAVMLTVTTPQDLKQRVGQEMGVSEWVTIDQEMIDKFAEATGDHQWSHVDVARAKRELPIGNTIAHGYLTLSLLPRLSSQLMKIETSSRGVNYGSNKVRFTGMVPAGSKVRMRSTLWSVEDVKGDGVRIVHWLAAGVERDAVLLHDFEGELQHPCMLESNQHAEGTLVQLERVGFARIERVGAEGRPWRLVWTHG